MHRALHHRESDRRAKPSSLRMELWRELQLGKPTLAAEENDAKVKADHEIIAVVFELLATV
jgi:hypothetical protein